MVSVRVDEAVPAGGISIEDGMKDAVTPLGSPATERAIVAE